MSTPTKKGATNEDGAGTRRRRRRRGSGQVEARGPVIDISVLESTRAFQRESIPDLVDTLVTQYLADGPTIIKALGAAVEDKNTQDTFHLAHKLKSDSGYVGAVHLSSLLKNLGALGRQNKIEGATDLYAAVVEEFESVRRALEAQVTNPCCFVAATKSPLERSYRGSRDKGNTMSEYPMGSSVEGSKKPIVLIVDDEIAARLAAGEALLNAGFAVEEAEDGVAALRILEELKPDIVISDVMMPVMDGFALCEEIRRRPGGHLLPVLMVTALDDIESIHQAYEVGATDFITKPFNWLVLTQRIRHMVRESELVEDLRKSEAKNRALLSAIPDVMFRIDSDGTILESRESKDFDLIDPRNQVTGKKFYETMPLAVAQNAMKAVENTLNKGTTENLKYQLMLDGAVRHFEARVVASGLNEALIIVRDVTDRRRAEDQLLHDALYDPLTGLANRTLLMDRLEQSLGRAQRSVDENFAILFLDLDRFKNVNDTFGHMAGDKVLIDIGQKLQSCVRPGDTVARIGGDEFVILLENVTDQQMVTMVTERIECGLSQSMSLEGQNIVMSSSIGIVLASDDYEKPEDVLRDADIAVYRAKAMGRGCHVVFDESMYKKTMALIELESELRRAVERQEFFLQYQPIVSL